MRAVAFDFGQTLAELDPELLASRLSERGAVLDARRVPAVLPAAWEAYARAKRDGFGGERAWVTFLLEVLRSADATAAPGGTLEDLARWLFSEQPRRNLWRRPLPGMPELLLDLRAARVPLAIVSNSEGRLAELVAELGWNDWFQVIADSGRLGVEKPDPAIFRWVLGRLGLSPDSLVHVGDVYEADVRGALAAGVVPVWFGAHAGPNAEGVAWACDAAALRALLSAWGLLP